jgi:hypothetical protein
VYDPPEANGGTAGDIWALGVTLAESLTRAHPLGPVEPGKEPVLPPDFPPTFADAVRRCLSYEPTDRPAVADLKAWTKLGAQQVIDPTLAAAEVATIRESAVREAPHRGRIQVFPDNTAPQQALPRRRSLAGPIAGSVSFLLACWAAVYLLTDPSPDPPTAVVPAPAEPVAPTAQPVAFAPEAAPKPVEAVDPDPIEEMKEPPQTVSPVPNAGDVAAQAVAPRSVLHKEIPKVPRAARETIQDEVRVIVRVIVDSSGTVVGEVLADPGSSSYFAQLAINASRNWKFAEADDQPSRQWLVRFVFSRDGTEAHSIRLPLKRTAMSH